MESQRMFAKPWWIGIVVLSVVGLAGCATTSKTTMERYAGDNPVRVVNRTPHDLCGIHVSQPGESNADNWLRKKSLPPGEAFTFTLKPGAYNVWVVSCDKQQEFVQNLSLQSPIELVLQEPGQTLSVQLDEPPDGFVRRGPYDMAKIERATGIKELPQADVPILQKVEEKVEGAEVSDTKEEPATSE